MSKMRGFLLHIGVVCSMVCIIARILDWYNPYMDFTGHIWAIQLTLYLSVIVLEVTRKYAASKRKMKQAYSVRTVRSAADHTMRKLIR